MDEFIGILTFIDFNESKQEDCQFLIGSTSISDDKQAIIDEAIDLTKQYLANEYGPKWMLLIENSIYGVRLDIIQPGDVHPALFLQSKMAEIEYEEIVFQEI